MKNAPTVTIISNRYFGPQNPFCNADRPSRDDLTPIMSTAIVKKNMVTPNMMRYTAMKPTAFLHISIDVQNGAFANLDWTPSDNMIQDVSVDKTSITTYMTLVMVEFGQLLQPAHAKLQAALEQQQASCIYLENCSGTIN